jgi:hypothetical protein
MGHQLVVVKTLKSGGQINSNTPTSDIICEKSIVLTAEQSNNTANPKLLFPAHTTSSLQDTTIVRFFSHQYANQIRMLLAHRGSTEVTRFDHFSTFDRFGG